MDHKFLMKFQKELTFWIAADLQDPPEILTEMKEYIDSTYSAHYAQNGYQATEIIESMGHGMGFALGNVLKYVQRYGKKEGYNRADLLKVIH